MSRLLREIGLTDSGGNIRTLKASLVRMANVTVLITQSKKQASFHWLSYAFDDGDGRLFVALNPRIAEAILGERSHARIDMNEVRALISDPSRLIHQRLCGWIDPGKFGRVSIDTFCSYVWPDESTCPNTIKKRRKVVRKALNEFRNIGWLVQEYARGKWKISRPQILD